MCIDGIVFGRKWDERKKGCIVKASDAGREGGRRRDGRRKDRRRGVVGGIEEECAEKVREEECCTGRSINMVWRSQ
jgi:hypothetical protein